MSLKFVEVVILLIAAGMFVAWQMHDLRRAREKTRREREAQQQAQDQASPGNPHAP